MTNQFLPTKIPIFLLFRTPEVLDYFRDLLRKINQSPISYENATELMDNISSHSKVIAFIEDIVSEEEGTGFYEMILEKCPGAKIILVCKKNRRRLIKDAMEKGGYGSVVEPYDPWEITTMVKHLLADLSE
ncbi:MAG: hypothetical protein N2260_04985 [Syntrophobacterales bacterium]|nr:hypothetical protein [Syntrophobacterales bacterium]